MNMDFYGSPWFPWGARAWKHWDTREWDFPYSMYEMVSPFAGLITIG